MAPLPQSACEGPVWQPAGRAARLGSKQWQELSAAASHGLRVCTVCTAHTRRTRASKRYACLAPCCCCCCCITCAPVAAVVHGAPGVDVEHAAGGAAHHLAAALDHRHAQQLVVRVVLAAVLGLPAGQARSGPGGRAHIDVWSRHDGMHDHACSRQHELCLPRCAQVCVCTAGARLASDAGLQLVADAGQKQLPLSMWAQREPAL